MLERCPRAPRAVLTSLEELRALRVFTVAADEDEEAAATSSDARPCSVVRLSRALAHKTRCGNLCALCVRLLSGGREKAPRRESVGGENKRNH